MCKVVPTEYIYVAPRVRLPVMTTPTQTREQRGSVSRATRLHRIQEICVTTNTLISARGRLPTPMPAPATTRIPGPAGGCRYHQLGNKPRSFPPRTRPYVPSRRPCPPPRLGRHRARVRTRRYLWTVQAGGTHGRTHAQPASVHSGRFPPLTGGCFLRVRPERHRAQSCAIALPHPLLLG